MMYLLKLYFSYYIYLYNSILIICLKLKKQRPLRRPRRQDPTLQDLAHRLHPSQHQCLTVKPALDTPGTTCTGPAHSTPGQVSVLNVTPSRGLPYGALARMIVMDASERPLKTSDMAIPTVSSSPTINQEPSAVTPQNQHSGRLQHISYAEAVRKYPVLDSGVKSGSPAAVPQEVNVGQAASMPPGVESFEINMPLLKRWS
ncbi:hypothetical protein J6590_086300 [Homalodisca vitripennis]|nr:hypothetical protein J6590_086300 [Homalodisca vitripennis]